MARRSDSRKTVAPQSRDEAQRSLESQQLSSIDLGLAERLSNDERFRDRYLRAWAANEVASELRAMRKRRAMTQAALARKTATGQSAISRIEKQDYDGWTFKTLLTIALALRARLRIQLEPIEDVIQGFTDQLW